MQKNPNFFSTKGFPKGGGGGGGGGGPLLGKIPKKYRFFFWKTPLILFDRSIQVLVSTDCAGMGVHVPDLRLVVNVGMTMIDIFSQKCSLHT